MQKLFVVAEHVYGSQSSTGYFWSKLIEKLALTSASTSVVTTTAPPATCNKTLSDRMAYVELDEKKYNKNKLAARFLGQVRLSLSFIHALCTRARKGDVVITGTNPALLLTLLPWAKVFVKFKWYLLVHDVFPENLVPAKILTKDSFAYWLVSRYFAWAYSKADLLYVIGRDMEKLISLKIKNTSKVIFLPNWVDENDVNPISKDKSRIINQLKWQEKIVFQFFGNIGRLQGIENILHAIELVQNKNAAFLFIGDGATASLVTHFCSIHPNLNIHFYGPLDQSEKNEGLAACDVALVTLEKGMEGLGVPSKFYFTMAADKPILAVMDSRAEISMTVREHKIGWTCDPVNPVALAAVIDKISGESLHMPITSPREVLVKNFSANIILEKLVATLDLQQMRI